MKTMKKFMKMWLVGVVVLLFGIGFVLLSNSYAKTNKEIDKEVNVALKQFKEQVEGGKALLKAAKGVLVIPGLGKIGVGAIGGEYGSGALRIKGKPVGYYDLMGGSFGFEIGGERVNLILLFMEEKALKHFEESSDWQAGADANVTFLKTAVAREASTDTINKPVIGVIYGEKGLMANASIEGAKFTKRTKK
jgi:lipid-binding SYLF domain-containing protein